MGQNWKYNQCGQKIEQNFAQFLLKSGQKWQNICIKAGFESLKPPHQTTVETLKYQPQTMY